MNEIKRRGRPPRVREDLMIPSISQEPKQEGLITLRKEDLEKMVFEIAEKRVDGLMNENQLLKQQNRGFEREMGLGSWKEAGKEAKRSHTATFKLYRLNSDDALGLIIDWKHFEFEYDPDTKRRDRDMYKITCLYEDGSKKDFTMPLTEFSQITDMERVDILEWEEKELVMVQDKIRRSARSLDGYIMSRGVGLVGLENGKAGGRFSPGELVNLEVRRTERVAMVKRGSGQTFKVNESRLNA